MSQRIELVNEMEDNIQKDLDKQEKTYEDYTIYLENLVEKFHCYMSSTNIKANPVIFLLSEHLKIKPIPDTSKPVYPLFTAGQCQNADVAKLLGKTTFSDTKPEQRKIKPMETASTTLKSTEKQRKQAKQKSDVKQTVPFSSYVREYTIPDFDSVYHLSLGKSGRLWVSDDKGRLVKTDGQGNLLQKIQTSGKDCGIHTVTLNGDLIYLDTDNKVLFKIAINNAITKFVETGARLPLCLCSFHISEDIFVGMIKGGESKVTRYNKTGKKIQNIQRDNKGQGLYSNPRYITENINGDICVSDLRKKAVVVVKKSGQHRFSYKGRGAVLYPFGLCTDNSGNIVVCDSMKNTIHLLDQDGQFIFQLLTGQHEVKLPRSVCVDDENNIYVGQYNTNALKVYMYLQ
ncbi:uncharacterized protein LOC128174506 [Crassostrea angulata]|uniref:uncharacterized protein LOC128174506 n=1 Tax=Magallana angulata TaxID=2784310 RepID=UPI0022B1F130|nr:uncharacterized protein LOC128174506 [Crassostrea angulata]